MLVREKHRKTLYRFLLIKINLGRQITYGDKIQNTTTTRQNEWQIKILTLLAKMGLKIQSLHYYSKQYKINDLTRE